MTLINRMWALVEKVDALRGQMDTGDGTSKRGSLGHAGHQEHGAGNEERLQRAHPWTRRIGGMNP